MRVVVPLAWTMLLGGLRGRGFLRSWCLGCLAVCLWYESLRSPPPVGRSAAGWRFPVELGTLGRLVVRHEHVRLGLATPVRILYASDLHLGRWWTRAVVGQLFDAARQTAPDLILLGGDLADNRRGLPLLRLCVRRLAAVAAVHAVPGNHDARAGLDRVRAAVCAAGGHWLPERPIDHPVRIDGRLDPSPFDRPRLLCAHHPGVFPAAAAAGYSLVLAGHLHGGQCVLMRRHGRLYPAAWLYRWHGLRFVEAGAVMLVSRGAADTLPLRFNCPREVVLCEIT
jgi:predicted MPP superfamily phosphohydrolase